MKQPNFKAQFENSEVDSDIMRLEIPEGTIYRFYDGHSVVTTTYLFVPNNKKPRK